MKVNLQERFPFNKFLYFLIICVIYWIIMYARVELVEYKITSRALARLDDREGFLSYFITARYITLPFYLAWKITFSAVALWVGAFMFGYRISFRHMWQLVLISEAWFLLPDVVQLGWWLSNPPNYIEYQYWQPLSMVTFADFDNLTFTKGYVLKALNLFELGYVFFLGYLIHDVVRKSALVAFAIPVFSYAVMFLLWLWAVWTF